MNSKGMALTFADRCKNILAANWHCHLNTIKADSKGSNQDIHSSRVKYLFRRGKPYIWIKEDDLHNVNTIVDERGSVSVSNNAPGPLVSLLRSVGKLPARVALIGDVLPLSEEKVHFAAESLRETISAERKVVSQASYSVSGILSTSTLGFKSDNLQELLDASEGYSAYKFRIRSCTFIDGLGGHHEVDIKDVEASKTDPLSPFSLKLIDGINQSQARRRGLMLFCYVYLNTNARDAFMLSVDQKGFDILGKVSVSKDGFGQYEWKELRFSFKEEAQDIEDFCRLLVEMEEEALKNVSSYSGLG